MCVPVEKSSTCNLMGQTHWVLTSQLQGSPLRSSTLLAPDEERLKSAFDTFVCYSRLKLGNQISGSINLRHSEGEKSWKWWWYYRRRGIIMPHQDLMGDNGVRLAPTSLPRNLNTVRNVASSMDCDTGVTLKEHGAICSHLLCFWLISMFSETLLPPKCFSPF